MAKKIVKKKKGIIKKKFYQILAPKAFNEVPVGEIYLAEPKAAIGRKMKVNLMAVTSDPQKQTQNMILLLKDVSDNKYSTEALGFRMLPAAVKRLVRRNREKVGDSFVCKTKDGKLARIKPLIVTRGKTTNSVVTAIRKYVQAHIAGAVAKITFEQLLTEVIGKKIQHDMIKTLKKFHPISICEIRMVELIDPEKARKGINLLRPPAEVIEEPKKEKAEA